ncbi:hypothetical protein C2E23DRAFT_5497 [Lenzites betulinus]|nr:hypothetical protein C2E23DRAFT_5497 [Lenzites betulinus]
MAPTRNPRKRSRRTNPDDIPRPSNAWILYRTDRLKVLVANNGGVPIRQSVASTMIGEMWQDELPEVRAAYEKRAELAKAEHRRLHPDYKYKPKTKAEKLLLREEKKRLLAAEKAAQKAGKPSSSRRSRSGSSGQSSAVRLEDIDPSRRGWSASPPVYSAMSSPVASTSSATPPMSHGMQPVSPPLDSGALPSGHSSWPVGGMPDAPQVPWAPHSYQDHNQLQIPTGAFRMPSLLRSSSWDYSLPPRMDDGSPFGAPATPGEADFGLLAPEQPPVAGSSQVPSFTPNEDDGLAGVLDMAEFQEYLEASGGGLYATHPLSMEDILRFQNVCPDQAQEVMNTGEYYRAQGSAVAFEYPHMTPHVERQQPYVLDPQPDPIPAQDIEEWLAANPGSSHAEQPFVPSVSEPGPDPLFDVLQQDFQYGPAHSTPPLSMPSSESLAGPSAGPSTPTYGSASQFFFENSGMSAPSGYAQEFNQSFSNYVDPSAFQHSDSQQLSFQQSAVFAPSVFEQPAPAPEPAPRSRRFVPPGGAGQAGRRRVGQKFRGPPLFPGFTEDSGSGSA